MAALGVELSTFLAYNDALRVMFKYPGWERASYMFVTYIILTFQAVRRNFTYTGQGMELYK